MDRYRELSDFTKRFAAEYRGWMTAHAVPQTALAAKLGRTQAYVSERVNGRRPLDTEDVDALAALSGTTGRQLMIELARRSSHLQALPYAAGEDDSADELDEL